MGRIMAIDYGQKRSGLAISDPCRIIAGGLATVASAELLEYIKQYVAAEDVELFVVGYPRRADNSDSDNMKHVAGFVRRLGQAVPQIPVEYADERFTSVLAKQAMISGGLKKKKRRDKALVDEVSAVIILQSYLESKYY
ncbi:MAG: Holliday junction resolvase RuvX [Tannerellaceae bacterium]|jgi:putative Holliday junction resolvase|nr:Holliday junction resolvase RuvX [Tannerellaceae bacterium]